MTYTKTLSSFLICSGLITSTACTKAKQDTQQGQVNPMMTDARPDLSNQPSPVSEANNAATTLNANANPADAQKAVTTNPNSSRNTTDSTINTSAGAVVVGNANMNPRMPVSQAGQAQMEAGVPTSVDTSTSGEPESDKAVDRSNCRDAIANHYDNKAAAQTNNCSVTSDARKSAKDAQVPPAR